VHEELAVPTAGAPARGRVWGAVCCCLVVLAVWNALIRPHLAQELHPLGGLVVAAAVLGIAWWSGLGLADLGLEPRRVPAGLAWGGAAFGLVALVLAIAIALPTTRAHFHTQRGAVGLGTLLFEVLITIPIGTILVEEIAFRGVLLGLFGRLTSPVWAVVWCSLAFGLWHADGVIRGTGGSGLHIAAATIGTILATGGAGVAFCWFRLMSKSLLASFLAHLATNTLGLVAVWIVVH
jgi:uncharacterized protein